MRPFYHDQHYQFPSLGAANNLRRRGLCSFKGSKNHAVIRKQPPSWKKIHLFLPQPHQKYISRYPYHPEYAHSGRKLYFELIFLKWGEFQMHLQFQIMSNNTNILAVTPWVISIFEHVFDVVYMDQSLSSIMRNERLST